MKNADAKRQNKLMLMFMQWRVFQLSTLSSIYRRVFGRLSAPKWASGRY